MWASGLKKVESSWEEPDLPVSFDLRVICREWDPRPKGWQQINEIIFNNILLRLNTPDL